MVDAYKFIFFKTSYLFIFREGEGKEKERERNINVWLPLMHPLLGACPGLQPRHVPWLVIEPATIWFSGWCSIHWATPARADAYKYIFVVFSLWIDLLSLYNVLICFLYQCWLKVYFVWYKYSHLCWLWLPFSCLIFSIPACLANVCP